MPEWHSVLRGSPRCPVLRCPEAEAGSTLLGNIPAVQKTAVRVQRRGMDYAESEKMECFAGRSRLPFELARFGMAFGHEIGAAGAQPKCSTHRWLLKRLRCSPGGKRNADGLANGNLHPSSLLAGERARLAPHRSSGGFLPSSRSIPENAAPRLPRKPMRMQKKEVDVCCPYSACEDTNSRRSSVPAIQSPEQFIAQGGSEISIRGAH